MIQFKQLVEAIYEATVVANNANNSHQQIFDTYFEKEGNGFKARTVTIQHPVNTKEGLKTTSIDVPLITLVPISTAAIENLKFTTDIEIALDGDDNLLVSFGKKEDNEGINPFKKKARSADAQLELTLSPQRVSDGLGQLIEGYERVLRSQIPT
ncbi:DUF2589 domain-containing protein [Neptunitalea lumnitzerae]|uniref:DUF2589 domain-containing protein n=1 Tax=Neptunitalea lumnitzerae TaxID=2965509 RepID=A0ABQ5MGQ7_9FLAO|nr:DUF2589 domain-containing protein [Neptunitalea sp. Y10]GLB48568.1 hypothetical protein Y10_09360 [Neptunitalea sp. Y10]